MHMEFRMWNTEQPARESVGRGWTFIWFTPGAGSRKRGGIMLNLLAKLFREEIAQDLAEYGIALATITIIAGIAAVVIARDVGTLWSKAQSVIDNAATS